MCGTSSSNKKIPLKYNFSFFSIKVCPGFIATQVLACFYSSHRRYSRAYLKCFYTKKGVLSDTICLAVHCELFTTAWRPGFWPTYSLFSPFIDLNVAPFKYDGGLLVFKEAWPVWMTQIRMTWMTWVTESWFPIGILNSVATYHCR